MAGNQRFVKGELKHPRRQPEDFAPLAKGQAPLAVIVGCSDSRCLPEIAFDQGVGDLFVARVAGNIVDGAGASVNGSIEYAVAVLGVRLVMVLGHSQCGAVKAAIKYSDDDLPGAIGPLVKRIRPAVEIARTRKGNLLENAIQANVEQGVKWLKQSDPILAGPVKKGTVKVVGAEYDLRSGKVRLLD
jgi:carbonic anhydrase